MSARRAWEWIGVIVMTTGVGRPGALRAQSSADPVRLVRTTDAVALDGRPRETAWNAAPPVPLVQYTPTEGAGTSDSSDIRLLYDDKFLYVGARLFVEDPGSIRPGLFARDQLGTEDHLMVILDSAGDERTGLVFALNPAGGLTDNAIGGDGQNVDKSWNGYWDGATSRDESAWYAEFRIPISTLRFQPGRDGAVMGVIIHRQTAARNEMATYPRLPRSYANGLFRPSIAHKVHLAGIAARSPVYLTPYLLGGANSAAAFDPDASAWGRNTSAPKEAGVDVKLGLTSNVTLDLTANTDFAQVEADNQQVNLTRFSLFFPEKRQFFLERGDLFQIGVGDFGPSRLFHSRRIGLAPDGSPLRIYGGARVAGRAGALDFGMLSMQTATADGQGTENDAVVRVRRSVLGSGSYLGALVTSRLPTAGGYNVLYAADAVIRPFGNDYVTGVWAQSFDDRRPQRGGSTGLARINWARRSQSGLVYTVSATWQGADFEPGLGFIQRRKVATGFANVRYGWFPGTKTVIQNITPSLVVTAARRNDTKLDDSRGANLYLNFALKSGISGFLVGTRSYERLDQGLTFGSATIPARTHQFDQLGGYVSTSGRSRLSAGISATVGEFYDGTITTVGVSPSWNASAHFQAGADFRVNRIRFGSRNQRFDADQAQVRASYAHDAKLSVSAFVQYSRAAESVGANVRIRYRFSEGRDLWIVYNDLLDADRIGAGNLPRGPLSLSRTLVMKYTHTLTQ